MGSAAPPRAVVSASLAGWATSASTAEDVSGTDGSSRHTPGVWRPGGGGGGGPPGPAALSDL